MAIVIYDTIKKTVLSHDKRRCYCAKTQNEKYFPIDSSFWEWRKGKDIRELDDFYRYINLEIGYIVNELEKRWPNNDDDNQNGYEKMCFKHNIRKPIILATMIGA